MNVSSTFDSANKFSNFASRVAADIIVPNLVWKAGRYVTYNITIKFSRLHFAPYLGYTIQQPCHMYMSMLIFYQHILSMDHEPSSLVNIMDSYHVSILTQLLDLMQNSSCYSHSGHDKPSSSVAD